MGYNYDFDITAIVLYLIIFVTFLFNKHIKNANSKIFFALLSCCFFTPVLDIIGGEVIVRQCSPWIVHLVNNLYYLTEQATNFLFLVYILSIMEMSSQMSLWKKAVIVAPFLLMSAVIITNPLHGYLYKYGDDFVWITGPFRKVIVFLPIFYFAYAAVYAYMKRITLRKKDSIIVVSIAIINTTARVIQYFIPSLLVFTYSVAIGILLLFIGFQLSNKMTDPETGLANRSYLAENVRKLIYNNVSFTTIMVRIADYDALTTTYGIRPTEAFMHNIAFELSRMCDKFQLYLINTNSFAITLVGEEQVHTAQLEEKIAKALDGPWQVNGMEMRCSYYVTAIPFPEQYVDREGFISYLTFFQKMRDLKYGIVQADELKIKDSKREADVELAIERAISDNSFDVYYQPICDAKTQRFAYAEALVRLKDPELGYISPAEFIPLAETNGTIIAIGNIVLDKVCKFMYDHDLKELGLKSIEMNLSTTQCLQTNFIEVIRAAAKKYKVEKRYLGFEITETASNYSTQIFTDNLSLLRGDGYKLILDDYGSGYSNLQRLVSNDFDVIKFDKDMIQRTCDDPKLHDMFDKMQAMFHSMGASVVAEGVETKEQYELLKSLGVDYIQGYYFSRPLPEDEFVGFLKDHKKQ